MELYDTTTTVPVYKTSMTVIIPSPLWVKFTVDPKGVIKLLNNLNMHKAPGPDGLSTRVLKECSSEIAPVMSRLLRVLYQTIGDRQMYSEVCTKVYTLAHLLST